LSVTPAACHKHNVRVRLSVAECMCEEFFLGVDVLAVDH
jgi:hypothetical protein